MFVKKLMITSQVVAAALRQQAVRGRSNDRHPHEKCCHRMLSHSPIKLQVSLNTSITSLEHHYWSIFAVPYLWVAQAGWSLGIGWEGRWLPARTSSMSAPPFRFPPTRNMSFCPFVFLPFCLFVLLSFCQQPLPLHLLLSQLNSHFRSPAQGHRKYPKIRKAVKKTGIHNLIPLPVPNWASTEAQFIPNYPPQITIYFKFFFENPNFSLSTKFFFLDLSVGVLSGK